jgi:hypothetical protein
VLFDGKTRERGFWRVGMNYFNLQQAAEFPVRVTVVAGAASLLFVALQQE